MQDNNIEKIDLTKTDWRSSREFFESLAEALDQLDSKEERYDFTWVGKRKAIMQAGAPINKTLRPDLENSKNWDTTENLFIEGDNLDALKLLQESYLGKVKMIYIDPPYNTGKDFVYRDNFKASVEQYDEDTEYKDDEGNIQFKKNEKTNGRYHSDWLSMMYPRLKLARNLLSEDGVIFISIDDNEQDNLKKIGNEIFGEDNLVAVVPRIAKRTSDKGTHFRPTKDYVIIWARNLLLLPEFGISKTLNEADYNMSDSDGRKYKQSGASLYQPSLDPLRGCANQRYFIEAPDGSLIIPPGHIFPICKEDGAKIKPLSSSDKVWRWSVDTYLNQKHLLIFTKGSSQNPLLDEKGNQSKWNIYPKVYLDEDREAKLHPEDIIYNFPNSQGTKELKMLSIPFTFAKPTGLLLFFLKLIEGGDFTVLDFFSGSATTAHAVMQLNAEDGGNRKWIMVQLPEETDEKSEAFKAGYKTIPEISRERIRRAAIKIETDFADKLQERNTPLDTGFRALRIDDTNYKGIHKSVDQYTQESLLGDVDNIKADRSNLDLLFGVLTQSALELHRPLEKLQLHGSDVYRYDYLNEHSGLVACFAHSISEELIQEIAKWKPLTVVFRDSSFPDSQAKVNLAEHFRILSPDTKIKVI